ncbi:MAG: hypothetical protein C4524_07700, partial [Candidatus Zixiibacteriota bacterium]
MTEPGIWAQRLDSLGNRLWGDNARRISPIDGSDFRACVDGQGGFYFTMREIANYSILRGQHLNADGYCQWADSGLALVVTTYPLMNPSPAPDGQGGFYLVWVDYRPPYSSNPGVFRQRFNALGQPLWSPATGIFLVQFSYNNNNPFQVLPDGQNGILMHLIPSGVGPNPLFRIGSTGTVLWQNFWASYNGSALLVAGEPGIFYLGYKYFSNPNTQYLLARKVSVAGSSLWPDTPGLPGTLMMHRPDRYVQHWNICPRDGQLYGVAVIEYGQFQNQQGWLAVQALDEQGAMRWTSEGITASILNGYSQHIDYPQGFPDASGGLSTVSQYQYYHEPNDTKDLYAKHVNVGGALGGPFPLGVTLTPQSSPVIMPPQGGSFSYNLAVADTDTVGGLIDLWITATLPSNIELEIIHREDLTMPAGGTLARSNLMQTVPAAAPPGIYTYSLYAGDYPSKTAWGEDSFSFEKQGAGGWGLGAGEGWRLSGDL